MAAADTQAPPAAPAAEVKPAATAQPPQTSLYVGDLLTDVVEQDLHDAFSKFGIVTSVYICRDTYTRQSLGYGYVNFAPQEHDNARNAMEQLNYTELKGKPMRIMWVRRDPTVRKTGRGNIFVKNLPNALTERDLYELFRDAVGPVMSCKVARDPRTGESRCYGFVHFENDNDADDALKLSGKVIGEQTIEVVPFVRKAERPTAEKMFTNVYVKNLPDSVDNEKIVELFSKFGKVTKSAVMTDDEGKSRGFGFVNFDTHEEATAAIEGMHEQEVDGRKLYCARAQPKAERERVLRQQVEERRRQRIRDMEGRNVFVKNLADSVDDDGLRKLFQDALGEKDQSPPAITSARVMKEGQVSKGFGFVCFAEKSDAQKALKLSGKVIEGKPLFVSMAQRKEERQKALMTMRFQMGFPGGMPGMMMPYGMMPGPGMPQGRPGMPGMIPAGMPMGYPGMQGRGMGPMGGRGMQGRGMGPGVGRGRGGRGRGGIASATMPPRGRGNRGGGGVPRPGGMLQPGAMPQPVPGVAPGPQGAAPVPAAASTPAGEPDLVTKLAHAPEGERKNILGEELYPLVQKLQPELAPKITGMFLELEDSEVLLLIADEKALQEKVDEALTVLKDYGMIGAQ